MHRKLLCILIIGLLAGGFLGGITQAKDMKSTNNKSHNPTTKYTLHAPIRINNDADFTNQFSNRTIWGLDINGTGYGYCIYIGNCSLPFTVNDCYLHNASGPKDLWNTALCLYQSSNGILSNNVCNDNIGSVNTGEGIELYHSNNNTLISNTCNGNLWCGICIDVSTNNSFTGNLCNGNPGYGIVQYYSNNSTFTNNNCSANMVGIFLVASDTNMLIANSCDNNLMGIELRDSILNILRYNNMYNCGIYFETTGILSYDTQQIDTTNFVNDKPVYYWKNQTSGLIPSDAGQIILANCSHITVEDVTLTNCSMGIQVGFSNNCTFSNNTCSGNLGIGIDLQFSNTNWFTNNNCNGNLIGIYIEMFCDNNTLTGNKLQENTDHGIFIDHYCSKNRIYHNNFINNEGSSEQAWDETNTNFWNSSYPTGGNYWSDWTGPDNKSGPNQNLSGLDGIVDLPYLLGGGGGAKDYYPLVYPPVYINMIIPNGGQIWDVGSRHNITWIAGGGSSTLLTSIYYSTNGSSGPWIQIATSTINYGKYEWTIPNAPSTNCYIRVNVTDSTIPTETAYDMSAASFTIRIPPVYEHPSVPQNLHATGGNGNINLTWSPPLFDGNETITNYEIYRGNSSGTETRLTEMGNVTSFKDTGVINGNTYFYKASAKNVVGEGPLSNEIYAKPISTIPSAPRNVQATANSTTITLTWEMPALDGGSQVTNYRIYKGNSERNESYYVELGNILTYSDLKLSPGTYYYKISAKNSIGESPMSNETHATIQIPKRAPSVPLNLIVNVINNQIMLTWNTPNSSGNSSITNYKIYYGKTSGKYTESLIIGNVTTYTFTNLAAGTRFYFVVSAINSIGESQKSNEASAIIVQQNNESDLFLTFLILVILLTIIALILFLIFKLPRNRNKKKQLITH